MSTSLLKNKWTTILPQTCGVVFAGISCIKAENTKILKFSNFKNNQIRTFYKKGHDKVVGPKSALMPCFLPQDLIKISKIYTNYTTCIIMICYQINTGNFIKKFIRALYTHIPRPTDRRFDKMTVRVCKPKNCDIHPTTFQYSYFSVAYPPGVLRK